MADSTAGAYQSALIIAMQRIGDVLLATPIIASLKRTWPDIAIDVMVFAGTEGVLEGNENIGNVIRVPRDEPWRKRFARLRRIWRRYDLAISPIPGDRPVLTAFAAGRRRFAPVGAAGLATRIKRLMLTRAIPYNEQDVHTVTTGLQLAELAGAQPVAEVQVRWHTRHEKAVQAFIEGELRGLPFAILHPSPKFRYKMWHAQGWRELATWLLNRGLQVVLTGGNEAAERAFAQEIFPITPIGLHNRIGAYSLGEIAALLARARLYVGPDTVITHMAAALGIPTVALFGPSDPVRWGPWPRGYGGSLTPYQRKGTQRVDNVMLIQGQGDCVPCLLEGCNRHIQSDSRCLQTLPSSLVEGAIEILERK